MKKKVQVVCVSTNQITQIIRSGDEFFYNPHFTKGEYCYLYFLSNDKIKEGDWVYSEIEQTVLQACKSIDDQSYPNWWRKIVATTDSLPKVELNMGFKGKEYFLPRPSNEFLQFYCKINGAIEYVMIDVLLCHCGTQNYCDPFTCSHFENPVKVAPDNTVTITPINKKEYTKDEVIELCLKMKYDYINYRNEAYCTPNTEEIAEWTENWLTKNII